MRSSASGASTPRGVDALAQPDDPHLAVHVAQRGRAVGPGGDVGDEQADRVRPAVDGGHARHALSLVGPETGFGDTVRGAATLRVTRGGPRRRPLAATLGAWPNRRGRRRGGMPRPRPSPPTGTCRRSRTSRAAPAVPPPPPAHGGPDRHRRRTTLRSSPATTAPTASRTSRRRSPASTCSPATPPSPTPSAARAPRALLGVLSQLAAARRVAGGPGARPARRSQPTRPAHPRPLRPPRRRGRVPPVLALADAGSPSAGVCTATRGWPSPAPARTSRAPPAST